MTELLEKAIASVRQPSESEQKEAISGHKTLAALERYLGVTEQQKESAISTLDF